VKFEVDGMKLFQVYVGFFGGQIGTVTGFCGVWWWAEWYCTRFLWGFVVDRVTL